jgi:hypothetical protein
LGLLLFRKQKYSQRIFWTLPIAFILFSVANISNSAIDYYGFYQEYNYFTAKQDIKKGKIQILETGLVLPEPSIDWEKEKAAQKITEQHFGYKSINLGCNEANGIAIYNNVMENHLEKMNGKDWRIKEQKLRDSILKSINPK